ncbi:LysR family transcriptional regulator [Tetragenococcus solitarius]|uniref:LysR family transcriptional regulator n=1 Tax=Tetragenococcus solitarius TaxID=71453 RepID=A0ABP6KLY0_9ENTE|nr:LysR family transcriptional regulator [Tetragenococcus solitarius]
MEIRLLRYFIAVANQQNISAAAQYLHISQPTLSRQLSDLEEELNTTLFIRGNRKVSLTPEGIFLLKKAKEIVGLVDKTTANFSQQEETLSGEVYIGAGETKAMCVIAKSLKKLLDNYPAVQFHLYSGNADDIMDKLDSGLLDFGIVIEPADKKKYDYIQLPAIDTWGVLMHKNSPLAEQTAINPKELLDKPLIISRQTSVDSELSGWLGKSMEDLNIIGTYNLLYNAALMAEEKLGYVLCLDHLINTTGDSNLCFRPLIPQLTTNLNIIWKKHQIFSSAAQAFLEQLRTNLNLSN